MLEPQVYQTAGTPQNEESPEEAMIEVVDSGDDYATIEVAPLRPGFGITLGNAIRRVLLSSLPGAAVTSVRIDGVQHEFSTISNLKEDTIEFLLNVKELNLRALSDRGGTLILDMSGREGPITAEDIQVPEHYEIVNQDLYLCTTDSKDGRIYVEFNIERGFGYAPAGQVDGSTVGVIPVDAIFSPVRKVNYRITNTRVGQATNYDKLILEVWTDGTISGVDAISKSAEILMEQFELFSNMGRPALPVVERGLGAGVVLTPERFNMPIEDLNLTMRAYNCLRRSGLTTVGQVLEKSEEELLALRNFGRKSYDELRVRLDELELLSADAGGEEEHPEAAPLGEGDVPMRTAAVEAEEPGPDATPKDVEAASEEGSAANEDIEGWKKKLQELTGEIAGEDS